MSAIIIPRKHLRQPQGRVLVRNEWLDTGLGMAVLPSLGPIDVVSQSIGVFKGTTTANADGVAYSLAANGDALDVKRQFGVGTRQFTWLSLSKFTATATSWVGVVQARRTGTSKVWYLQRNANQGARLGLSPWNGSSYAGAQEITLPALESGGVSFIQDYAYGLFGIAFDSKGTGTNQTTIRQYANGGEWETVATASGAGTFAMDLADSHIRVGSPDSGYGAATYTPWPVTFAAQLYWPSVALNADLVREILGNPWQLFRADPIRIYSLPSGPISISWSSLTASNLTQTGATLTLGGITR